MIFVQNGKTKQSSGWLPYGFSINHVLIISLQWDRCNRASLVPIFCDHIFGLLYDYLFSRYRLKNTHGFAFHKSNLYTPNMTKGFWEVDHFFLFTHGSKMRHIWGSPYVLFFLSPWPHHLQQDGPVSRVVRLQSAFFCALIQFLSLYNCGLCSLSNNQCNT